MKPRAGQVRKAARSRWCEVRRSPIHGSGVFAARNIPAGTQIIEYVGEVIGKKEAERRGNALWEATRESGDASVFLFILDGRYDLDGNFPWNDARLINHSCEPNCETEIDEEKRIWVIALRNIAKGEELFFDYNFDLEDYQDHPCLCGTESCLGYIVGAVYRKALKKKLQRSQRKKHDKV